ncbi:thioesterase II family protein [Streptomyces cinereoruber]|uniref:thioesterase II family protein n=1 Tax=Streptomyces cinereoruber TaxID=67260 RepID=UPI0036392969
MPLRELSPPREPAARPALTLVLLHHAGGSSRGFGPLLPHLPRAWRVLGVDLPGRFLDRDGARCRTAEEAVAHVHREVRGELASPYAVFGHSMGALLAYELVRRLEDEGSGPDWLGVSGSLAPHLRPARRDRVLRHARLPTAGLPDALAHRAARAVREDLRLIDGYTPAPGPPLRAPLAVFGGTDDPLAPAALLDDWTAYARPPASYHLWPGGHFFLFDHAESVCARMAEVPAL